MRDPPCGRRFPWPDLNRPPNIDRGAKFTGQRKQHPPLQPAAGRRLQRVLTGIVTQVEGDLRRISGFPEGGIHSLRRRMKKLQPILALARGRVPRQTRLRIKRHLRLLKDAFAGRRDADVMHRLAVELGVPEHALAGPLFARTPRVIINARHWRAASKLRQLVCCPGLDSLTWDKVARAFLRNARRERKAWRLASAGHSVELLHAWRRSLKAHYYQMLLVHRLTGRMQRRLRLADSLGRWLGKYHDLELLASWLRPATCKQCKRIRKEIWRRQRKLQRRIFRTAAQLHDQTRVKGARRLAQDLAAAD